ncbi:MAG TPA: YgjP-like metallopeptidase domain-containing protein [Roseiflexaceae bacterium]|nr:YgjP-like metallopeptidase domain-containing protein [Roseiflexaceae bacterium]
MPRVRKLAGGEPNGAQAALKMPPARDEQLDIGALEQWLWDAACVIRGATDAPEFKDFILPLVFYKRLSDVYDDEVEALAARFQSPDGDEASMTERQASGTPPPWHNADDLRWAVRHWAARMGLRVRRIQVRAMASKWASMSTSGNLTLNSELLDLPQALGEYVIVHELVHLLAPNHSKVFKSFLFAYLPDWQERAQRLRSEYPASG